MNKEDTVFEEDRRYEVGKILNENIIKPFEIVESHYIDRTLTAKPYIYFPEVGFHLRKSTSSDWFMDFTPGKANVRPLSRKLVEYNAHMFSISMAVLSDWYANSYDGQYGEIIIRNETHFSMHKHREVFFGTLDRFIFDNSDIRTPTYVGVESANDYYSYELRLSNIDLAHRLYLEKNGAERQLIDDNYKYFGRIKEAIVFYNAL